MKNLFKLFTLVLVAGLALSTTAWGQVSLTTMGVASSQNFDGMGSTGTTTPSGWYVGTGTAASGTTVVVGTGSSTSGGNYNFGVAGTNPITDRALGSLAGSSILRNTEVRFTNNTGSAIAALTISFTGEQWRLGQTASLETGIVANYSIDGTNYTAMGTSFNFVPPITVGTAGALDGNATANRTTGRGGTYIPSSPIANGTTFYLRWVDSDNSGSDAANAIDDFSLTPLASSPIVNYYSKSTGDLDVLSNWGTNTDGSGTSPSNFTSDFQYFNVVNNTTPSIGAAWTVSGSNSKIVVGDGVTGVNFTIPSSYAVAGTVDITAGSTVTVQNATSPTWSILATTSTVVYNPSGTLSVPASTYYNLTLLGGTQTFAAGITTVAGNLVLDGVSNVTGPTVGFSTVNLAGNLTAQNGTTFNSDPTYGITLVCNGTSAQALTGNGANIVIFRLTMNNAAGVSLSSSGGSTNLFVGNATSGGLTFTNGKLTIGSNNVTISSIGTIVTPLSTKYVVATGSGQLRKTLTAIGSFIYPVGDASNYSPVTLNFTSGTYASAYAGVNLVNAKHSLNTSTTDYLNRYWTVTQSGITSFACNADFVYVDGDFTGTETNLALGQYNGVQWNVVGAVNATTNTLSAAGLTSFSDFTGGEAAALPVQIASFVGSYVGNGTAKLEWSTISEVNNYGFNVQRQSGDEYVTIGFVAGKGEPSAYEYIDAQPGTTYRLEQIDNDGLVTYYGPIMLNPNSVGDNVPAVFALNQNYPNPFNPTTVINYQLATDNYTTLKVYNLIGKEVATLVNGYQTVGYHQVTFNGTQLSNGIYFYKLQSGSNVEVKKLTLVK